MSSAVILALVVTSVLGDSLRSNSYSNSLVLQHVTPDYLQGGWRKTLDICWLDRSCTRVMTISHGGDWSLSKPYDSFPAFQQANQKGADTIKGDFRVCKENTGMIMHSSPIEFYESLNCIGKKVEEMTVEQCESCRMALTTNKFISLPTLLSYTSDSINVMLCVKLASDIPRAISSLIEYNATRR